MQGGCRCSERLRAMTPAVDPKQGEIGPEISKYMGWRRSQQKMIHFQSEWAEHGLEFMANGM